MISEIVAVASAVIALIAISIAFWQNSLTRRMLETQILLTLKQQAKEADYIDGVYAIRDLKEYSDYETYLDEEPEQTRRMIASAVDFLNFVAHLVEDKYLPLQTTWNFYFHAYRIGYNKLLPWWLQGIRADGFQRFTGFERMCELVGSITHEAIVEHESKDVDILRKMKYG